MPTYLIHGFRWHRQAIRIHIILNNLDECAAEWIVAPLSSVTFLNSFYSAYDFIPASSPPASHSIPVPERAAIEEKLSELPPPPPVPKTLSKKNTRSMSSLRSLGRRKKDKITSNGIQEQDKNNGGVTVPKHERQPSSSDTSKTSPKIHTPSTRFSVPGKPVRFNDWSAVKLVEQYDPEDLEVISQPYAYVGDYMVDVTLSASITEEMSKYEAQTKDKSHLGNGIGPSSSKDKSDETRWLEKLRDGLQPGEEVGWYVVVCGDEERKAPTPDVSEGEDEDDYGSEESEETCRSPRSGGFRNFFRGRRSNDKD